MKLLRLATFLALSLFGVGAARAATLVAAVGDSITQNSGWTDRLAAKLGAAYTVKNYGLSGATLMKAGDHPYWATTQFTQSHTTNPDIVVIMLGTNDSKPFNWTADHKGQFAADYAALIDTYAALASHPKVYLVICPPAGVNGYKIVGSVIENEIDPLIRQLAVEKGLPAIDMFTAFGGHDFDTTLFSAGDQVHPNGAGAQRIADTVYAALVAPGVDGGSADARRDGSLEAGGAGASGDAGPGDARLEKPAATDATGGGGAGGGGAGGGPPPPVDASVGAQPDAAADRPAGGGAGSGGDLPPNDEAVGCGCATSNARGGDAGAALASAALLAALVVRRRRRR